MGYSTDFSGELKLSKPLTEEQFNYINKLVETRRMKRDVAKLMETYKGKHGYPGTSMEKNTPEEIYGNEGEFFVGGSGYAGQGNDTDIIDYNCPPGGVPYSVHMGWEERQRKEKELDEKCLRQPGLWCQWVVEDDENEMTLVWDGGEKFYNYIEWLKYLINKFFQPWGVMLNGDIEWTGEDSSDFGLISVRDNVVMIGKGKKVYEF